MAELVTSETPSPLSPATDSVVNVDHSPGVIYATHLVRKQLDLFSISSGDATGSVAFSISLDAAIDEYTGLLSKGYTFYRFKKFDVEALAVSPLGTSSGAAQIAYIPDPENITPSSDIEGIRQLVRQLGSRMMRPRDTTLISPVMNEWRFCKPGNEPRLHSFGAIVGVVRAPPNSGDFAEWAVTVIAEIEFALPTSWDNALNTRADDYPFTTLSAALTKTIENKIVARILASPTKDFHVPERHFIHLKRTLIANYTYEDEKGRETTKTMKFSKLECRKVNKNLFEIMFPTDIDESKHSTKIRLIIDADISKIFNFLTFVKDARPIQTYNKRLHAEEQHF